MIKKIKICIVLPILSPYWIDRLKSFKNNDDIDLILLLENASFDHRPGWNLQPIDEIKIQIVGSTVFRTTQHNEDLEYSVEGVRSVPLCLFPILFQLRPDIVVCCNATQILISFLLKLLFGIKLAILVEDTPHATRNVSWINSRIKAWAYNACDIRFPFSDDAVTFLENIGITDHISRSSWSLDMEYFKTASILPQKKNESTNSKTQTVIFVGKLIASKGVLLLVEAWHQLPKHIRTGARLLIAGSGPLKDKINLFVQQHNLYEIILLGQIDYTEVCNKLRASDLFVLPTLQDLFSLTILEAMACGCPVITTPFNGARELVENDHTGWIVDPTIPFALSKVLCNALSDSCDLKKMGKAARLRVEKMDNKIVMDQFAQDLRAIINC